MRTLLLTLTTCLFVMPAQAKYSGGTGEPNDPYQIATAADLIALGETPNDYDKHFILTADIDLDPNLPSRKVFDKAVIAAAGTPFTGVLDGRGLAISNLKISRSSAPVGLFGSVNGPNACIKNLRLANPVIDVGYQRGGSVVGYLMAGTLSNCQAKGGRISSRSDRVGGLVGESSGTIADCNSTSNVSGQYGIGGIAGKNSGHIARCSSRGGLSASYSAVGGIVGDNSGTITECWSACNVVSSSYYAGGVVGINRSDATIRNSYSQGIVSGRQGAGGLVGRNEGTIRTCYSACALEGTVGTGGLVGVDDDGHVYSSFWDTQRSGQITSGGGWGKTTREMQTASTFVLWGRDRAWTIDDGRDYPHLAWQNVPGEFITTLYGGGDGGRTNPYLIYTPEQLGAMSYDANDWDEHFKLMEDLDLAGVKLYPISRWAQDEQDTPFSGVFDGNGKVIRNFQSAAVSSGLFDYVAGAHAEIRDLTLIDPNVNGIFVGSLVGCLEEGTVKNCGVASGSISGGSHVGGLIGFVTYGVVKDCYSNAGVIGGENVGGLIGMCRHEATVMNCTARGAVRGTNTVGGLVGLCEENAIIMNCESSGNVSATEHTAGGLVGQCLNVAVIAGSSASGNISGPSQVGGLVGNLEYARVVCCYATGSASGAAAGGLVGKAYASYIADSYSVGQVIGTGGSTGGLVGLSGGYTNKYDCFWNIDTSGQTSSSGTGAKALNTPSMQDPTTFINAGWDLVGESANGPSDIWTMPEAGGYPILSWQASPLPPLPSFSGGTGEPNDPFIVSTPQDLNTIGQNPRLMAAHFMLANDIDLTDISFFLVGGKGFPFMGVFDGKGHTISNFSHEVSPKYCGNVGLFRYLRGSQAEIKGLTLMGSRVSSDVDVSPGADDHIGLLIGLLHDGTIRDCYVQDGEISVKDADYVGGLVGYNNYGTIEACASLVRIKGLYTGDAGGIVGCNRNGEVIDCHSDGGVIDGYMRVGGIAGSNWYRIENCSASGYVSGWHYVGGLVGWNLNSILTSCSYSETSGSGSVGGLVGENIGSISNCYARGKVSGGEYIGGLVGDNTYRPRIGGSIVTSYSTGLVAGDKSVAGFVHRGDSAATTREDCFWDIQTSRQASSDGGVGKTTAEMQTAKMFLEAGWDFIGETTNGSEDLWWILEGKDYPRLWWEQGDEVSP